jgi:sugar phosphate isomerase/epimerase
MTIMTRRKAIGFGLAGAAALATGAAAAGATFFKRTKLPLGLQLYTLGGDLRADLDGQLAKVAAAGYRAVEMAGYLGKTPKDLRAAFDKAGLVCPSAHVQAKSSATDPGFDALDKLIADAHVIGWRHIVLPSFPTPAHIAPKAAAESYPDYAGRLVTQFTADDWKAIADLLNAKGRALKAAGLSMGYHNHNFELAPVSDAKGSTGLDLLLKNTDPALVHFEMDVGWVVAGGGDPFALLKAHPGRFTQMHVKDVLATTKTNYAFQQDPTEVGSGVIPWPRLLPAAYAAGVRGFFVEQEAPYARPRLDAVKISADYLLGVVA